MSTATNISTSSPALRSAVSATAILTTSSVSRNNSTGSRFGSFTTENRARFLNLVSALLPEGITHIQLFSGGAEAVEAAFRLAKSVTKKFEFIGFWGGYHGKTAGVIGLLGGGYRNHQGPFPPGMHLSPYANCYRCPWNLKYPSCGLACAEHLRNVIKNDTQGEVAAIIIEPMQGTAGNVIPPDEFIHAVREIADECGALLIADEILTGFGRTGTMWASEQFDLKPDIMTIGKGIGGGFPLSAVASSFERMSAKPFGEPSGSSSSYGGNPLAAAAGLGAVEVILDEKLVENSARVGAKMLEALKRLQEKYRFIGDVRGRGLMIGVEMVADRKTKAPLDKTITRALFHEALERGLITMSYSQRHSHQSAPCDQRGRSAARDRYPRSILRRDRAQIRARLRRGTRAAGRVYRLRQCRGQGPFAGLARPRRCHDRGRDRCRSRPAGRRFSTACPERRWYDTVDDLLSGETLDFVDICAPPGSHAALIGRALDAGLHVLCEKPLVTRVGGCETVASAAARAGRVLHTVHNWLKAPICLKISELIDDGAIGAVRSVRWRTLRTQPATASARTAHKLAR